MADLESTQLRKGVVFRYQGKNYLVLNYKHVKKGRGLATIRCKVKNIDTGAILEKTFTSNEKVESVDLKRKSAQYLYSDDEYSYFMDSKSYSQFQIKNDIIEWEKNFLQEGLKVNVVWVEENVVDVEIPKKVDLEVKYTEPAVIGDTACGATKEAELRTGYKLQVPLFIKIGDLIKINTESGGYVSKG